MFKGRIVAGAYTAGNLIPISQTKNTNDIFELKSNEVYVKKGGIVDVKANIVVTASGTTAITAQLYGNGNAIDGALYTITPADGGKYTLIINDAVIIERSRTEGYAKVGIKLTQGCTIVDGNIVCEHRD